MPTGNPILDLFGGPLITLGTTIIDRVFPDKEKQAQERAQAQLTLLQMQQDGSLKELHERMSIMLAEAQSADPWTSRARPSFLYVMYAMILFALPMGVLAAFRPDITTSIAQGMQAWLAAIPDQLYWLFGSCFTGYSLSRSIEKNKGLAK